MKGFREEAFHIFYPPSKNIKGTLHHAASRLS